MEYIWKWGGERTPVKFTVNSVCMLEEETGKPLSAFLKTRFSCMRALLWCGLLHEKKNLTLEETGRMMDAALREGVTAEKLGAFLARALTDSGFFPSAGKRTAGTPGKKA